MRCLLLLSFVAVLSAATYPNQTEGDFVVPKYKFRSGEQLDNLKLHYTTIGTPVKNSAGIVSNAVLVPGPFNTSMNISYQGIETGADIALLNIKGSRWNAHLGILGGETSGKVTQTGASTNVDAPFLGGYMFLTNGGFTLDVAARHDWLSVDITDAAAFGTAAPTHVAGVANSFTALASYRFETGNGFSLTPSAGLTYSQMSLNNFAIAGNGTIVSSSDNTTAGRVGVRLAYLQPVTSTLLIEPFVSANAIVQGRNSMPTSLVISGTGGSVTYNADTVGSKEYQQYVVGLEARDSKQGFSAFAQGSLRDGDRVSGSAVSAGGRINF